MRRGERVNASDAPGGRYVGPLGHPTGGFELDPPKDNLEDPSLPAEPSSLLAGSAPSGLNAAPADQGPCLYLGPSGERCTRRAYRDGYCINHQPTKSSRLVSPGDGAAADKPSARMVKVITAIAALLGFLAPMLDDLVRAILRWLHSH